MERAPRPASAGAPMRTTEGAFRILGTHHVAIHTPNVARLGAFYVDTLGLRVVGGFPDHGILFVDAGGTIVELIETPARGYRATGDAMPVGTATSPDYLASGEANGGGRHGWNHVAWVVEDVDAAYTELGARGVTLRSPPESFPPEAPAFRIAFVADPDGNLLELLQPLTSAD